MAETKAARPTPMPRTANKRDMTAAKLAFALWLRTPIPEHPSQVALAKHLGVDSATLSDWKHDQIVIDELDRLDQIRTADWSQITARLVRIALTGEDAAAVTAGREVGKLWGKYPSEKVDHTVTERVAYVQPGALRELSAKLEGARPN